MKKIKRMKEYNMKKKILAVAISSIISASAQADITDILITEYVEGSSNNKAIELTNYGAEYTFTATDTLQYSSFDNIVQNAAGNNVLEGITIEANESIVIANGSYTVSSDPAVRDISQTVSDNGARIFLTGTFDEVSFNSLNFNGDDHVSLHEGDVVRDIIGTDSTFGENKTLRRRLAEGDTIPSQTDTYSAFHWNEEIEDGETVSTDNYTGLGLSDLAAYVEDTGPVALEMTAEDGGSFKAMLARYEGQEVMLPVDIDPTEEGDQDMRVTRSFGFNFENFRNNMTLSYIRPNMQPNQDNPAGSAAAEATDAQNKDYTLLIESSTSGANGEIPYYPEFNTDPTTNYIRIDDSVIGMEGVISYDSSNDTYTLTVSNTLTSANFTHNSDRENSPSLASVSDDEIEIKVATQNLLNFFNSPYGGDANSFGDNRGADDESEYEKQLTKLVAAVSGLDADIIGLMEIENNGFGNNSAIQTLVDEINSGYDNEAPEDADDSDSITNRYVFIGYDSNQNLVLDEGDSIGSDAISTGLLYRPSKVSIASLKKINMPAQHAPAIVNDNNVVIKDSDGAALESGDNFQRDTLAATFKINGTGKTLTVAVNHFKSKGSTCWEEWDGVDFGDATTWSEDAPDTDLQGACENLRVSAAVQLGEALEDIGGDRIIVGDLNAYGKEDPLLVLTENPTNKTLTSARDSFIGSKPQFNTSGSPENITKTYGYKSAVSLKDDERGQFSWSYSFNDDIGSLDHILITPSLTTRLVDAVDWHINAAESSLYDYNDEFKGATGTDNVFYAADPFRSSDHDSAIMALSYQYAEVGEGEPVYLTISSSTLTVPYLLAEGALVGDIVQISLSSTSDMSDLIIPTVEITENDQSLVDIELYDIEEGDYTATLTLVRDGSVRSEYTKTMQFTAAKQDSTTASVAPAEAYDGSGGATGYLSLLVLLGLGFLRRQKSNKEA